MRRAETNYVGGTASGCTGGAWNSFQRVLLCALATLTVVGTEASAASIKPKAPPQICLEVDGASVCKNAPNTPAPTGAIKWHPGHYMLGEQIGHIPDSVYDQLRAEPLVLGIRQRYWWAQLEPERGKYDFSIIEADIRKLKAINKRLVLTVADRSWSGTSAKDKLPDYLLSLSDGGGGYYAKPDAQGVIAKLWEPSVMDRMLALYEELGKRFDSDPNVEGVVLGESSPGFNAKMEGYTKAIWAQALNRQIKDVRASWPTTNVFMYTNSLVGFLQDMMETCYENKVGVGGPDVLPPPHPGILGDRILMGLEPGSKRDYRGKTPVGYDVQSPELCGKEGCHSPEKLLDYSVDTLKATHVFWVRFGTAKDTSTEKYSWQYGILPAIRANKGRINTACPANFDGACSTN